MEKPRILHVDFIPDANNMSRFVAINVVELNKITTYVNSDIPTRHCDVIGGLEQSNIWVKQFYHDKVEYDRKLYIEQCDTVKGMVQSFLMMVSKLPKGSVVVFNCMEYDVRTMAGILDDKVTNLNLCLSVTSPGLITLQSPSPLAFDGSLTHRREAYYKTMDSDEMVLLDWPTVRSVNGLGTNVPMHLFDQHELVKDTSKRVTDNMFMDNFNCNITTSKQAQIIYNKKPAAYFARYFLLLHLLVDTFERDLRSSKLETKNISYMRDYYKLAESYRGTTYP